MKIAYVSGPYRAPTHDGVFRNIMRAREVAREYWLKGFAVICPHTNTIFMDGYKTPDMFIRGDLEFIRRMTCDDLMVMLPGWRKSEGAKVERELAEKLYIPVEEYVPETQNKSVWDWLSGRR